MGVSVSLCLLCWPLPHGMRVCVLADPSCTSFGARAAQALQIQLRTAWKDREILGKILDIERLRGSRAGNPGLFSLRVLTGLGSPIKRFL